MTQRQLRQVIATATALVNSWPAWKQHILEDSSLASVVIPRQPVDNFTKDIASRPPTDS